jgi:FkbM family methyltransferase
MLIPFWVLRPLFAEPIRGVVHVGAHEAEELQTYSDNGIHRVAWIECQPEVARRLARRIASENHLVIEGCAWSKSGVSKTLRITNNSVSSSLLRLKEHKTKHPTVVEVHRVTIKTKRLDELIPRGFDFNFLNLDIQGAELEAIRGLGELTGQIDYIYSEVNQEEMYAGLAKVAEIDSYLGERGFARLVTSWTAHGWGDALYSRVTPPYSQLLISRGLLKIARLRIALTRSAIRPIKRQVDRAHLLLRKIFKR